jgi:hypothetical protein
MVMNSNLRDRPSVGSTSRVAITSIDGRSFCSFGATSCRISLATKKEDDQDQIDLEEWIFAKLPSKHNVFDPSSPIFHSRFDSATGKVFYSCALCNGNEAGQYCYSSASQIAQHCELSSMHGNRIKNLYARRERIKNGLLLCRSLQFRLEPRIQQLGSQAWRNHVRSEMMVRFNTITGTGKRHTTGADLINADALLCEYELLERVSLLKMISWKALCVMEVLDKLRNLRRSSRLRRQNGRHLEDSISRYDNDDDDLDMVMEWLSDGWKASKPNMRRNPSIDTIVKSILPFLGGSGKGSTSILSKT